MDVFVFFIDESKYLGVLVVGINFNFIVVVFLNLIRDVILVVFVLIWVMVILGVVVYVLIIIKLIKKLLEGVKNIV